MNVTGQRLLTAFSCRSSNWLQHHKIFNSEATKLYQVRTLNLVSTLRQLSLCSWPMFHSKATQEIALPSNREEVCKNQLQ